MNEAQARFAASAMRCEAINETAAQMMRTIANAINEKDYAKATAYAGLLQAGELVLIRRHLDEMGAQIDQVQILAEAPAGKAN